MVFAYSEEKNQVLLATRQVGFEDIITAIADGNLLADIAHPSQQHSSQRVFVVNFKNYAYAVPYVVDFSRRQIFLKTIYPSRVFTKRYIGKRR